MENPMSLPADISGKEPPAGDGSALDALIDFYRAFNAYDLNALAANWTNGEAPSMDNPIGGIRRGWPAIREGYAKLFSGPATVRVRSTISCRRLTMTFTSSWDVKKATAKLPLFGLSFEFVRLDGSSRWVACGANSITMGLSTNQHC
jgi:hypothetical protein